MRGATSANDASKYIKITLFALSSAPGALVSASGALESASRALERDLGDAQNALVLH